MTAVFLYIKLYYTDAPGAVFTITTTCVHLQSSRGNGILFLSFGSQLLHGIRLYALLHRVLTWLFPIQRNITKPLCLFLLLLIFVQFFLSPKSNRTGLFVLLESKITFIEILCPLNLRIKHLNRNVEKLKEN